MQLRKFGRTGMSVTRLCLGTATFGRQTDERMYLQILDKAADAGINFIDTANFDPMGAEPRWRIREAETVATKGAARRLDHLFLADQNRLATTKTMDEDGHFASCPRRRRLSRLFLLAHLSGPRFRFLLGKFMVSAG